MSELFNTLSTRQLRPHQIKATELLRSSFMRGNRRVVIHLQTGAGKTLTAAKMIESALSKGKRVMFTVPRLSLINQTVDEFMKEGINDIGVIQGNHPRTNPLARVQVASLQTLGRRDFGSDFDMIIIDEAHEQFDIVPKMMADMPNAYFVGLSATPWAKGMGLIWQDLVQAITLPELIDQGYLSKFVAYAPDVPDMSGVKISKGDYAEGATAEIMAGKVLMASIVQTWLEKGENRPTLLFGVNCAHAKQLQEQFIEAGIATGYCDAHTDTVERQILGRKFRSGEVKIACSVRTLTTGIDWPVSCIIDAAPTQSEMLHVQKIGRGLRVNPGTEDCLILDHAGNSLRLGLVTDIHHETLDTTKKESRAERKPKAEKLPKQCANCGALSADRVCPFCGHERRPVSGVETVDGELVQLCGKLKRPKKEEKQLFWSMAIWLDRERNRDGKLARGLYKGKFGVWAQGLDNIPVSPDQAFMNYEKSRRIAYAKKKNKERS